jgi:hypothetical protein
MIRKSWHRFSQKVMPKVIRMTRARGAALAQSRCWFSGQIMRKQKET